MIKTLKLGLLILCLPFAALAADYQAGKEYTELDTGKTAKPQVSEFFSFFCPHCYRLEPAVKALQASLPLEVEFNKSHVNFLGGLPPQVQSNLSFAYIIAKQAGKGEQVADSLFDTIHVKHNAPRDLAAVKALMVGNGISEAEFDSAMASMPVISAEQAMVDAQERYGKLGALTGVPTLIVNGKYKVNMREIHSQADLNDLVNYLLKL